MPTLLFIKIKFSVFQNYKILIQQKKENQKNISTSKHPLLHDPHPICLTGCLFVAFTFAAVYYSFITQIVVPKNKQSNLYLFSFGCALLCGEAGGKLAFIYLLPGRQVFDFQIVVANNLYQTNWFYGYWLKLFACLFALYWLLAYCGRLYPILYYRGNLPCFRLFGGVWAVVVGLYVHVQKHGRQLAKGNVDSLTSPGLPLVDSIYFGIELK